MKLAIGVMAYNRIEGVIRLLNSLNNAEYFGCTVDLIISIDSGGLEEVVEVANSFEWLHGKKTVVEQSESLKTKKHALWFGRQLLENYDALALFEDDIMVAPGFFGFMKATVEFYRDDRDVAGISFYRHLHCTHTYDNFIPLNNGKDVFFLQQAVSWGEIWLKEQWADFFEWFKVNESDKEIWNIQGIPEWFSCFPDSALMKWFNLYCFLNNKYFVEPYFAFSTCFHEHGVNNVGESSNAFQSMLSNRIDEIFNLGHINECEVYDSVCEYKKFNLESVCIDLHGAKKYFEGKDYLLTIKKYKNTNPIKQYGRELKPIELNVMLDIPGEDIRIYKVDEVLSDVIQQESLMDVYNKMIYEWGLRAQLFKVVWKVFLGKVLRKL